MFPVTFWLGRRLPLCRIPVVAAAVCHVSASQATCRVSRSCWERDRDLVAFSGSEGLRPLALLSSPFLPLSLFPSSPAVEGSFWRSGAVERPGAREPSWGGFSVLSSGFCSEGGTLAVAFGVATGQSSRSTFCGSDDALVAFSPPCRVAAGQWPRLRSDLLTLNATGDTPVVAIRLFWLLFCLTVFRLLVPCRVCRRWPTAPPGFPGGVPCVPVPAGLVLVTSQLCRFCGDCPACSLFARCSALEGLSHLEVVSVSWDPHPREPIEGVLRATNSELRGKRGLGSDDESFVELSCLGLGRRGVWSSWRRLDSPLSHCLSLHWFWSHVVVSGVRPQLGQAAVLRELVCFCGGSVSPFAGAEAGARLASRACGLLVPLLAASGGGLVAVVVTTFPHDFLFRVPVRGGTGVCGLPTSWRVRVRSGSACGPSTLWRSEVAVLVDCSSLVSTVAVPPQSLRGVDCNTRCPGFRPVSWDD
ncbi:hypothetical protein Taro_008036 [Colocasia esculenta]|uniref:Uncharacterized protein n=1 Tax=Colocasia esculenta TaxID=4460 RepID=A0A843TSS7_COLES|nr:hypothetical protein [Colocasia esculenta]